MKLKILLYAIFLFTTSSKLFATEHIHHDAPSIHGMLVMGARTIYLSHLLMFHSPHDYQVILEVSVDQKTANAYQEHRIGSSEKVYTVMPEVFALPEMLKAGKTFHASLFAGHFERGGVKIADHVTVTIEKVLYFQKFNSVATKPKFANFILFGNSEEQFIARRITAAPDYDQILKVTADSKTIQTLQKESTLAVVANGQPNGSPISLPTSLQFSNAKTAEPVAIDLLQSLYLETDELAH